MIRPRNKLILGPGTQSSMAGAEVGANLLRRVLLLLLRELLMEQGVHERMLEGRPGQLRQPRVLQ